MILEKRFGRWVSVGVLAILLEGAAIILFVHLHYLIALHDLLPPVALCLTIQIGFSSAPFGRGDGRESNEDLVRWLFWLDLVYGGRYSS